MDRKYFFHLGEYDPEIKYCQSGFAMYPRLLVGLRLTALSLRQTDHGTGAYEG